MSFVRKLLSRALVVGAVVTDVCSLTFRRNAQNFRHGTANIDGNEGLYPESYPDSSKRHSQKQGQMTSARKSAKGSLRKVVDVLPRKQNQRGNLNGQDTVADSRLLALGAKTRLTRASKFESEAPTLKEFVHIDDDDSAEGLDDSTSVSSASDKGAAQMTEDSESDLTKRALLEKASLTVKQGVPKSSSWTAKRR
jgi:hypothetical protein